MALNLESIAGTSPSSASLWTQDKSDIPHVDDVQRTLAAEVEKNVRTQQPEQVAAIGDAALRVIQWLWRARKVEQRVAQSASAMARLEVSASLLRAVEVETINPWFRSSVASFFVRGNQIVCKLKLPNNTSVAQHAALRKVYSAYSEQFKALGQPVIGWARVTAGEREGLVAQLDHAPGTLKFFSGLSSTAKEEALRQFARFRAEIGEKLAQVKGAGLNPDLGAYSVSPNEDIALVLFTEAGDLVVSLVSIVVKRL